jgi:hypothetical protein
MTIEASNNLRAYSSAFDCITPLLTKFINSDAKISGTLHPSFHNISVTV